MSEETAIEDLLDSQEIVLDEEIHVFIFGLNLLLIIGYSRSSFQIFLLKLFYIFTGGIGYLLCRWFPTLELYLSASRCQLAIATHLLVKNNWDQISIIAVKVDSEFHGTMSHVFPNYINLIAKSKMEQPIRDDFCRTLDAASIPLFELRFFEYRYHNLVFNPHSAKFSSISEWKDLSWNSAEASLQGVKSDEDVKRQIKIFGKNEIDVKAKSTFQLLFDEVLHPFYVFQVASIILWSFDDYLYYAACIFVISTGSAVLTLVETKVTMKRMHDLSRYVCNVRVWRGGNWWVLDSVELVPGDIFEITPGELHILPCDAILLDGDCIMNESMLTGESIPVSKNAITNEQLACIDFEMSDPLKTPEMSRYFLFSGTRVIRSRTGKLGSRSLDDSDDFLNLRSATEAGALAMCARVGFNTTKGSLVRSMMFPKPNKFQFYRDSWKFIGVLAIIASFGFMSLI